VTNNQRRQTRLGCVRDSRDSRGQTYSGLVFYVPTALQTSRLELGGDAYTTIFESWEVVRQVLHDPLTLPIHKATFCTFMAISGTKRAMYFQGY